jgi:hypothetical protein
MGNILLFSVKCIFYSKSFLFHTEYGNKFGRMKINGVCSVCVEGAPQSFHPGLWLNKEKNEAKSVSVGVNIGSDIKETQEC